jgi:hypothetical protein
MRSKNARGLRCNSRLLGRNPEAPAKDRRQSLASGPSLALQALMKRRDYGGDGASAVGGTGASAGTGASGGAGVAGVVAGAP